MDIDQFRVLTRQHALAIAEMLGLDPARVVEGSLHVSPGHRFAGWTEYDDTRPACDRLVEQEIELSAMQGDLIRALEFRPEEWLPPRGNGHDSG